MNLLVFPLSGLGLAFASAARWQPTAYSLGMGELVLGVGFILLLFGSIFLNVRICKPYAKGSFWLLALLILGTACLSILMAIGLVCGGCLLAASYYNL